MAANVSNRYAGLSQDALLVAKSVFSYMSPRSELRYDNQKGRAPARLKAALTELVNAKVISHHQEGVADVYQPMPEVDFRMFRRVSINKAATAGLMMSEAIDPDNQEE